MEVKIILILLLIHYIGLKFNSKKSNILSCGIFGNFTKDVKNLDVNAFNLLGVLNIDRGKSSCGISYDGEIYVGLDNMKLYNDFIKNRTIKAKRFPYLLGHTRQASVGGVNKFNSHPFGFGTSKDGQSYEFILAHNGTLKNHKELALKYNIPTTEDYINNYGVTQERDKIDSEILAEILYTTKNYKVLSEYIGAAALVWKWLDRPNKVYLFSGASRMYPVNKHDEKKEERPLAVFVKNKNNFFVSSLDTDLSCINGSISEDEDHPEKINTFQIDYNTIYVVTDGDFEKAEKIPVSRNQATQNEGYTHSSNYGRHTYAYGYDDEDYSGYFQGAQQKREFPSEYFVDERVKGANNLREVFKQKNLERQKIISVPGSNIYNDKPLGYVIDYGKRVIYNKLRYWRNGHLVNGIYTYWKEYGFYQLAGEGCATQAAETSFNALKGLKFVNGDFDFLHKLKDTGYVPFKADMTDKPFFYFIDGVMLRRYEDYQAAYMLMKDLDKEKQKYVDYIQMSHMSANPIIDLNESFKAGSKQGIILNGKVITDTFTPLGSEKIYKVKEGNLIECKKVMSYEEPKVIELPVASKHLYNPKLLEASTEYLLSFEKHVSKLKKDKEGEAKMIEKIIHKHFDTSDLEEELNETYDDMTIFEQDEVVEAIIDQDDSDVIQDLVQKIIQMQKVVRRLKKFPNNEKAINYVNTLEALIGENLSVEK